MVQAVEEITLTPTQESIVSAFQKQYPEASRFTAVKFCFGRKFELNRVFPLYEGYRAIVQERGLQNLTAAQVLHELRTQKMFIPGTRDKKGAALFVVQASKHVIGQFPPESTIKLAFYLGECLTASLKTQKNGITLIIDLSGTEWSTFDANFMAEIINFFQNHIPAAVKNILIWRAPWWIRTAIKIVSPFLKEKMRKRIKMCDNLFGLLEFVSEADLPTEFGGAFEYDHDFFIRKELSKTSNDDILSSLTSSSSSIDFAVGSKTLEMAGATCALSPTLEEDLQQERELALNKLEDKIDFFMKQSTEDVEGEDLYPVPIYDLMQNKIYRLTLDVTADYRPFNNNDNLNDYEIDSLHQTWRKAKQIDDHQARIEMMREALSLDKKEFLVKSEN